MPAEFTRYADYLGIPFADEDRGREGLHCFALARFIFRHELAIAIPDHGPAKAWHDNAAAIAAGKALRPWTPVSNGLRRPFDLIVYAVGRIDDHVAIAVDATWMIHVQRDDISRLDRIDSTAFGRLSGVYRHETLT